MLEFVKTQPDDDDVIRVEGYFAVTPAQMYEAWTTPEIIKKWFGRKANSLHSAEVDLRIGGAWRFLKSSDAEKAVGFEGEYLEIETDRKLVFSWSPSVTFVDGVKELSPASRVEVVFLANGRGTDVVLCHSSIQSVQDRSGFGGGWNIAFGTLTGLFLVED
ncbi:MAG: SRPBCC domain-containing protein [Alphaproteobacteria bacterium]|nr:SRPBCC domain-containing protein [Alphaproteobacteria bacterium]